MTIAQAIVSLSTKIAEYVENISKPLSEWRQKRSTYCFLPFAWQAEKRQHGSSPKLQYESTTRTTAVRLERNRNFHTLLHEQDHKWDWYGNNLIRRVFCQTSRPTNEPDEFISDENIRLPSTKKGRPRSQVGKLHLADLNLFGRPIWIALEKVSSCRSPYVYSITMRPENTLTSPSSSHTHIHPTGYDFKTWL